MRLVRLTWSLVWSDVAFQCEFWVVWWYMSSPSYLPPYPKRLETVKTLCSFACDVRRDEICNMILWTNNNNNNNFTPSIHHSLSHTQMISSERTLCSFCCLVFVWEHVRIPYMYLWKIVHRWRTECSQYKRMEKYSSCSRWVDEYHSINSNFYPGPSYSYSHSYS